MISGEVVAATAALCAASAGLVAAGVSPHLRRRPHQSTDVDAEVRRIVFRAIDQGDLDQATLDGLSSVQQRALESQARALLPSLKGEDRDTLGRMLDRLGTVDAARQRTHSKRAVVRAEAGEFLGESGSRDAVNDLLELLKDSDPKVRWSAARGLGRLGDPSAVPVLLACLEGLRAVPVDVVADAVFEIRDCPVALLRDGLQSPSVPTRALTVELLGRFQALTTSSRSWATTHRSRSGPAPPALWGGWARPGPPCPFSPVSTRGRSPCAPKPSGRLVRSAPPKRCPCCGPRSWARHATWANWPPTRSR
jgi:hypothetical protein